MMKRTFLLLAIALISCADSTSLLAQEKSQKNEYLLALNQSTGQFQYEHIYTFDSTTISKEQAYKNAKNYILSTLKTSDNNIVNDDKTFGEILNHGSLILKPIHGSGWTIDKAVLDFKVHIFFKGGRYKLVIDNIAYRAENMAPNPDMGTYKDLKNESVGKKFKRAVDESLKDFVNVLNAAVVNNSTSNSNW